MAVPTVPVAPGRDHHRPAGDRAPLAPTWFPRLLALEVPPRRRPSKDRLRDASADPADEPRQPAVGRRPDPRRIVDALASTSLNHPSAGIWPAPPTTVPRLEAFPAQSRC